MIKSRYEPILFEMIFYKAYNFVRLLCDTESRITNNRKTLSKQG